MASRVRYSVMNLFPGKRKSFVPPGRLGALAGLLCLLPVLTASAGEELFVEEGRIVYIEYKVELTDGTVVSNNVGKDPVVYEAGGNRVLRALDKALRGMKAGDSRVVTLSAADAFGNVDGMKAGDSRVVTLSAADAFGNVDDSLIVEVPLDRVPGDARTTGSVMIAENPEGNKQRVTVRDIRGQVAVLDYNHPLAGRELRYTVKILDVK